MHKIFNLILTADAYKFSHFKFLPEGTTSMTSYIEARGFTTPFKYEPEIVFNGLDIFIKEVLTNPITQDNIVKGALIALGMGIPFNLEGWQAIVDDYHGYLPITIEALPEGTITRPGVPLVQVTTDDARFAWLVSYIETALLRSIWYPTTVATLSREMKKIIQSYLHLSADEPDAKLSFILNDFSARGVESHEAARIGGAAHLINFMGTDNTEAVEAVYDHYGIIAGHSIPATEHSISTAYAKEHEGDYVNSVLTLIENGAPMAAIVGDTYDIYNFVDQVLGVEYHDRIKALPGKLIVRPDSGNPVEVTGRVIELLGKRFGHTYNSKGYKVLPKYIGMIQGDGIGLDTLDELLANFSNHGWSTENLVLGCGGSLLQKVNRDTLKFAQKANEITIDGVRKAIFKAPITDPGKKSKKGRQYVIKDDDTGLLTACSSEDWNEIELAALNELIPRYSNGIELNKSTFEEIRKRAAT